MAARAAKDAESPAAIQEEETEAEASGMYSVHKMYISLHYQIG